MEVGSWFILIVLDNGLALHCEICIAGRVIRVRGGIEVAEAASTSGCGSRISGTRSSSSSCVGIIQGGSGTVGIRGSSNTIGRSSGGSGGLVAIKTRGSG